MLFSTTCDRPSVANRGKRLMKLVYPLFLTKIGQTGCHISVVEFRKIARLSYKHLKTNLRDNFRAKQPKKYDKLKKGSSRKQFSKLISL
jgi:hypothetical protein